MANLGLILGTLVAIILLGFGIGYGLIISVVMRKILNRRSEGEERVLTPDEYYLFEDPVKRLERIINK